MKTKLATVLLLVTPLTGCFEPEVCDPKTFPAREFVAGQKVTHLLNKESVRVVQKWKYLVSECYDKAHGSYTVRFADGTEIDVDWTDLL